MSSKLYIDVIRKHDYLHTINSNDDVILIVDITRRCIKLWNRSNKKIIPGLLDRNDFVIGKTSRHANRVIARCQLLRTEEVGNFPFGALR